MTVKKKLKRAHNRAMRVRGGLKKGHSPRVSVYRSLQHIYAQLIDDVAQTTIASCSTRDLDAKGDKKTLAHAVGVELAKRAKQHGVETAIFDRGRFLYHGRVKELAEGLREGGLKL